MESIKMKHRNSKQCMITQKVTRNYTVNERPTGQIGSPSSLGYTDKSITKGVS